MVDFFKDIFQDFKKEMHGLWLGKGNIVSQHPNSMQKFQFYLYIKIKILFSNYKFSNYQIFMKFNPINYEIHTFEFQKKNYFK